MLEDGTLTVKGLMDYMLVKGNVLDWLHVLPLQATLGGVGGGRTTKDNHELDQFLAEWSEVYAKRNTIVQA